VTAASATCARELANPPQHLHDLPRVEGTAGENPAHREGIRSHGLILGRVDPRQAGRGAANSFRPACMRSAFRRHREVKDLAKRASRGPNLREFSARLAAVTASLPGMSFQRAIVSTPGSRSAKRYL
jgi:hypothetical protein